MLYWVLSRQNDKHTLHMHICVTFRHLLSIVDVQPFNIRYIIIVFNKYYL